MQIYDSRVSVKACPESHHINLIVQQLFSDLSLGSVETVAYAEPIDTHQCISDLAMECYFMQ